MECKDCDKGTKKYVKVCQTCREKEEDAKEDAADEEDEVNNLAAEFYC